MKALVVGAHDDDAPLWMGGTILRLPDWQWTVLSMCRWVGREVDRAYFENSCRTLGVIGIAFAFSDCQARRLNIPQEMKRCIADASKAEMCDYVFTHSRAPGGEYGGHCNHGEVREAVVALVQEGRLVRSVQNIVYFAYKSSQPDSAAPFRVELTDDEVRVKKSMLASAVIACDMAALGHPCPNPETFDTDLSTMPEPFVSRRQTGGPSAK
jgi:LmbE family N-acetylglucosaminyl deacetylase